MYVMVHIRESILIVLLLVPVRCSPSYLCALESPTQVLTVNENLALRVQQEARVTNGKRGVGGSLLDVVGNGVP